MIIVTDPREYVHDKDTGELVDDGTRHASEPGYGILCRFAQDSIVPRDLQWTDGGPADITCPDCWERHIDIAAASLDQAVAVS